MNRSPLIATLLSLLLLAGCGGSDDTQNATAMAVAADPSSAQGMRRQALAGPPPAPSPPGVAITQQPQSAAVATGAGVAFTVSVSVDKGNRVSGYVWHLHGVPVWRDTQPRTTSRYVISAAAARHAGSYQVEVLTTNGTLRSNKAELDLLPPGGWAQLGGRVLASSTSSQQPALSLCDGPTLAWIEQGAGVRLLRVSRFDGAGWVALGSSALNVAANQDAAEPSIDCTTLSGSPRPVVAWSEGSPGTRTIQVKAWDGMGWASLVSVGAVADAVRPRLQLAPLSPWFTQGPIPALSALAWVENGQSRVKYWSGGRWSPYLNGWPSGNGLDAVALALDLKHTSGGGLADYPPLLATVSALSGGQSAIGAQVNAGGWRALGAAPAAGPLPAAASPVRVAGLGFGEVGNGHGSAAAVVWTTGSASYTLASSELHGTAYNDALSNNPPAPAAWTPFANPLSDTDLNATSFDARPLELGCVASLGATRTSFALAVNDRRGTRVMVARCNGSTSDPMDWTALQPTHARKAVALSMKLEPANNTVPVFAAVEPVGTGYELSVWRFYP